MSALMKMGLVRRYCVVIWLIVLGMAGCLDRVEASTCGKSWVTVSSGCDTHSACVTNGAYCDIYNCYSGITYISDTVRNIYNLVPGWVTPPVIINGVTCYEYCTRATQSFQCSTCSASSTIASFSASQTTITAGEPVNFTWTVNGCYDNATVTIDNKTIDAGSAGNALWNGTDIDGLLTEPKKYEAMLNISGCCGSASENITITVMPAAKSCPLRPRLKSSVNLTTGSLLQSEQLFAAKGAGLAAAISLTYDSLDPRIGPLGGKWSHSYDIALTENGDGTATLREGNVRSLFIMTNGVYVAETGDYSSLVKTADNTFTLTLKDGTRKLFDAGGRIVSITDTNGNSLAFVHDASGNLSTVTDAAGRITTFAYGADNRITAITDPAGKGYTFSYSGTYLTAVTWPDNSSWQYTYDAKGFMLTKTDPLGKVTTYTYDTNHRVATGTDTAGVKTVVYPTATTTVRSSTLTGEDGGVWTYTYDSHNGYLTQKTDPYGRVTSYTYDASRNRTRETLPDGSYTSYTYDASGNMLTTTDALSKTTTYTYNILGQVTSTTDPLGRTVTSSYDSKGRLTKSVGPKGETTSYSYDERGNLVAVTDPLGRVSSFTYDVAGNQTSATDPGGAITSFTYDAMGNMLTQTDPLGKTTIFAYDGRYRLATVTDPLGHVTSYGYDVKGNRTSQTDANGTVTRYEYDDQGHLIKTIDSLNQSTLYGYGSSGCSSCGGSDRLTSLTDAKGQTTSFQYDLLGRLTSETDPLGKVTTFTYDSVGNLQTRTDANGSVVTYGYDAMKRLTGKSYPDSSSESFTYDAVGRVITAANPHFSYTYGYDTADRLTSVTDSRGYTITYQYDTLGNRTKMALQPGTADERLFTYSYDAAGRLTGIGSISGIFTYGYDTNGRRTSLAYPNGITAVYGYDDAGRLTSLSHRTAGTTIASFTYSHDNLGNRTSKTFTEAEQYLYDSIYRLITVTAARPEAFSYDPVGNRQAGPGAKDTGYLHDAANRMTKGRKLTYGYDNNGNQTEKTVASAATGWSQSWDFENRLIKVEKGTATDKRTVTFTYDPQGRRIEKKVEILANGTTSTETYAYVYDGDNILLEIQTSPSGATEKTVYTHGAGVDEHLALERNGNSYFYHADGLGSIVSITDRNKAVVQSYEYDSYGMQKPATTFRNSYTYTGREWDRETGLYYYRARYYDPMEGRFISKDPAGFKGGINLYGYVQENPINNIDPTGLARCTLIFSNGSGRLHCTPDNPAHQPVDISVASGNNGGGSNCKNNPECDDQRNRGPIPAGDWIWTNGYTSKPNGRVLQPLPSTDTHGRTDIRSHSCVNAFGPSTKGPFCSEGCVTGQAEDIKKLNKLLDEEPGSTLHVGP